jgi:acyl transferase domain-containing protein
MLGEAQEGQSSQATSGQTNIANGSTSDQVHRHTTHSINGHVSDPANGHISNMTVRPNASPEPIAICGLAMRLPGGIRDAEAFWNLLYTGKDMRGPIPSDRYNVNGFNDALGKKGAIKAQHGYFVEEDLSCLDTSFFTMTKSELEKADPQQRQILEVTRECLENAGEVNYRSKLIGCYVGTFGEDWLQSLSKENQHVEGYVMGGHGDLMLANRVSFEYDFKGPR